MPGFDVLSEDFDLFKNHFIEASAGTGKTFTIENIILRLLSKGLSLEEILVVTFTKSATLDLKKRVRSAIEKALQKEDVPLILKKKYERSLSCFDDCQIHTIHGMCAQLLFSESLEDVYKEPKYEHLVLMVKDYFRTELSKFPTFQIDKLMRSYQYELDDLIKDLLKIALKRLPIMGCRYEETKSAIFKEVNELKKGFEITPERVFSDLLEHASCYKGMGNKQKEIKPEVKEDLKRFSELFVKEGELSFEYIHKMTPENKLKKGVKEPLVHYEGLLERLQKNVFPHLEAIDSTLFIFAELAEGLRIHLLNKQDIFLHDDLLLLMEKRSKDPHFAKKIREKYKAVLIDEFQDTDHIQWKIFSTLFNEKDFKGVFYVVGDPKQSIYRFRGADIYTYFQAKKGFKEHKTLVRNYRSEPQLVKALNHLFSFLNPFVVLPKTKETIALDIVEADPKRGSTDWSDGKGSIHFIEGKKEEDFFAFIVEEIRRLAIPLKDCAALVKDRFQSERFIKFAKKQNIDAVTKKSEPLTKMLGYTVLQETLENLYSLTREGIIKILAGPLFASDLSMIEEEFETKSLMLADLKAILQKDGLLVFFKHLNHKDLISRDGGLNLYCQLLQLIEILEERAVNRNYLETLRKLKSLSDEDESIQSYSPSLGASSAGCISLYTIHGSKGLEFEVVFGLGLAFSASEKKDLILDPERRVFTYSDASFEHEKLEMDAEKMRLFYVACTRAKKRLYLPFIEGESKAPINLFLEKVPREKLVSPEVTLEKWVDHDVKPQATTHNAPKLEQPPALQLHFDPIYVSSYSKMTTSHGEAVTYPEGILPIGKETGILLHKILDELPFAKAQLAKTADEMAPLVAPYIEENYRPWAQEIIQIIFTAFHAPLPFTLASIDPQKIIKEGEFLYFSEEHQCYLKGFIDLVFEHNNKIYFIDWKSNYLEDYSPPSLEKALKDNNYFLQNEIYREAITRYSSFFSKPLGGSYYIFLRGITPNSKKGIFYCNLN